MRMVNFYLLGVVCGLPAAACSSPLQNPTKRIGEYFREKRFEAAQSMILGSIEGSEYKSPNKRPTLSPAQFIAKIKPCAWSGDVALNESQSIFHWTCPKPNGGDIGDKPRYVEVNAQFGANGVTLDRWCEATFDYKQDC